MYLLISIWLLQTLNFRSHVAHLQLLKIHTRGSYLSQVEVELCYLLGLLKINTKVSYLSQVEVELRYL